MNRLLKKQFICSKGLHKWASQDEADRCCNGWKRMLVPGFYGCAHIDRSQWYEVDGWFQLALIPVNDEAEIARLESLVPGQIREEAMFFNLVEN